VVEAAAVTTAAASAAAAAAPSVSRHRDEKTRYVRPQRRRAGRLSGWFLGDAGRAGESGSRAFSRVAE
jgi:hypothetical protein